MLRDFRSSLLSGSLVHHWGGRSVQERAFHLFPRVSHLLPEFVPVILFFGTADFTLLLLVSHLSTASFSCLRRTWDPNISFTVSPTCLSFVVCFSLCAPSGKHDLSTAEPHLSPTSVSVLRPLVSCLPSNFFDYFLSYMYMVSWQAPIRRLMFPSSVWAQRCITFVTCYLLLAGWNVWFRAAFVVAFLPCFVSYF